MTKRALKRMMREGEFDAAPFDDGGKIRRLPLERAWSPLGHEQEREQAYVKTIKPKSDGQAALLSAIDHKNLVLALGPAGTGKTYLAIAKAVEALEAGKVGRIVLSAPPSRPASRWASCPATWRTSSPPTCARSTTRCRTGCR
jgi:phosphate starvation-inducible PhoH-like protein